MCVVSAPAGAARIKCLVAFVSSVFACSSVLIEHMESQQKAFEELKTTVQIVQILVENSEYIRTLQYTTLWYYWKCITVSCRSGSRCQPGGFIFIQ